jgi:acetyl esterase/lipase
MASFAASIIMKTIEKKLHINEMLKTATEENMSKLIPEGVVGPRGVKVPKGYSMEIVTLKNGVKMEVVAPIKNKSDNVVYVLHGGGYIMQLGDMYRRLDKKLSEAGHNATVAFLDYRVAPEHRYPSALEDALLGWAYLLKQGFKPENIVVVGDSAGGNLTAVLVLKLIELKRETPKAVVLFSPWADMTGSGDSYTGNYNVDIMFGNKNEEVTEERKQALLNSAMFSYVKDADRKDPFVSPVFADYAGFPPTMIFAGTHEMLLSDSLTIADKIKKSGGEVELYLAEEMFHVWPLATGLFPEATKAMDAALEYIGRQLK